MHLGSQLSVFLDQQYFQNESINHFDPRERGRHTRKKEIVINVFLGIIDIIEYNKNCLECKVKILHIYQNELKCFFLKTFS